MKVRALLILSLLAALPAMAQQRGVASRKQTAVELRNTASLEQKFFSDFSLEAAKDEAEALLRRDPANVTALFVRMEAAELEERTDVTLDSALRLCATSAGGDVQAVASNRILEHAGNTRLFNSVLRQVKLASQQTNACTFNLRLALVAAAADGDAAVDLDAAAKSAGLLTRWRIAGPFGHFSNVDFERQWPPESQPGLQDKSDNAVPERFWFRSGMVSLPDYFPANGVYYANAESEIASPQASVISVLSAGPYVIYVDGRPVLKFDSRFQSGANRHSATASLSAGRHRVMVKFTADAAPLSIAVHPRYAGDNRKQPKQGPAFREYLAALQLYFRGDIPALARNLESATTLHGTAAHTYLSALLYSAAEEHSSQARSAWQNLAAHHDSALLAQLKISEDAAGDNYGRASAIDAIAKQRPDSEIAARAAFDLHRSMPRSANEYLSRLIALHPSCSNLREALKFFTAAGEQASAQHAERQLADCAPESLAYARALADSGRHAEAASRLQQFLAVNPLNRSARKLLLEELVLSNQPDLARKQLSELRSIAPNAAGLADLMAAPEKLLDSSSPRAGGFIEGDEFYRDWRRDAPAIAREILPKPFTGGSAVILVSDKVIEVARDGSASIYVHNITRVLNKDGIVRYGEASVPRGSDLLELRTIKASGQVVEPELAQQKAAISMPALEPGDSVEEEYVTHYPSWDKGSEAASQFVFGSMQAPVIHSRLVVLSDPAAPVKVLLQNGAPAPPTRPAGARVWERDNISQIAAEPFLPEQNLLPAVSLVTGDDLRDRSRDLLIDSSRAGLGVMETLLSIRLEKTASEYERARRLYQFVTEKIDSTGADWASASAEDTLAAGQGSRTVTLLALAHAAGLDADLVLARRVDQSCPAEMEACKSEPLVRFWLSNGKVIDVDPEAEGLPFGMLLPDLEARGALLVPLGPEPARNTQTVSLAVDSAPEKSTAQGDLSLDAEGNLSATIQMKLGVTRGDEVRGVLRGASDAERQAFFERLAMRIVPGATGVSGATSHERDVEEPMELSLRLQAPQFISRPAAINDIDQLVPALGLRSMYAKSSSRQFPLYIESLFFESAHFRLHLLAGIEAHALPSDFSARSEFGGYSVRFSKRPGEIEIEREFHIPVQLVPAGKYPAFVDFASRIDEAERQRISLEFTKQDDRTSAQALPSH